MFTWPYLQYNLGHVIICCWRHDKNYDVITIIFKKFYLRRPIVANFVDIIKIVITFIKKTFKGSKKC